MGILFSCPADDYDPLDMEEAPPAGVSGGGGAVLKALGSGKLLIEGSLSFKRAQAASGALHVETEISIRAGADAEPAGPLPREVARARFADPAAVESPKHEAAALRLQKVYKSFRTRRQLADCAVLVEQSWCVCSWDASVRSGICAWFGADLVFLCCDWTGGSCWISRCSSGAPCPSSTSRSRRPPCPSGQEQEPELPRYKSGCSFLLDGLSGNIQR
jgi:hypothetical protein